MEFFSLISLEMIHVFVRCLIYSLDYLKLPANSLQFLVIFFPLSNGAAEAKAERIVKLDLFKLLVSIGLRTIHTQKAYLFDAFKDYIS